MIFLISFDQKFHRQRQEFFLILFLPQRTYPSDLYEFTAERQNISKPRQRFSSTVLFTFFRKSDRMFRRRISTLLISYKPFDVADIPFSHQLCFLKCIHVKKIAKEREQTRVTFMSLYAYK